MPYSSDVREHFETFCRLAPNAERPPVVYSGEIHADVAVNIHRLFVAKGGSYECLDLRWAERHK